jgi:hypothetical protein
MRFNTFAGGSPFSEEIQTFLRFLQLRVSNTSAQTVEPPRGNLGRNERSSTGCVEGVATNTRNDDYENP